MSLEPRLTIVLINLSDPAGSATMKLLVAAFWATTGYVSAGGSSLRRHGLYDVNKTQSNVHFNDPYVAGRQTRQLFPNASLRGALQERYLQDSPCPGVDDVVFFGDEDISTGVQNWFSTNDGEDSFISFLITTYKDSLDVATGLTIRTDDRNFAEVCARLPLKDNTCYLSADSRASFFVNVLAGLLPFGEEIKGAYNEYLDAIDGITETVEEVNDFFFAEREAPGSCFAVNEDMIGIVDNPGFPPPLVYDLCNCVSMRTNGVPACTFQFYLRGVAFSTNGDNALEIGAFTGGFRVYDGYVSYNFEPKGDIWLSVDIEAKIPKLLPLGGLQDLVCLPAQGSEAKPPPKLPRVEIQTSLFMKNDLNDDGGGELLLGAAVERAEVIVVDPVIRTLELLRIKLGTAIGLLRVRSANPDCTPSGLFFSGRFEPEFEFGNGLQQFISFPKREVLLDFGVVWKDNGNVDPEDYVQAFFLRFETNFEMMGISVEEVSAEIQFFNDDEFIRRRDFNKDVCCGQGTGISNCDTPNSSLDNFLKRPDITPAPTLGLFLRMQNINFFGLVFFNNIQVEFIFSQKALDDFFVRFFLAVDVRVLFVEVDVEVLFEVQNDKVFASFSASVEVNVGLGTLTTGVDAFAEVTAFANSPSRNENESLLNADWGLDFTASWESAQWLKDLGKLILDGLKALADAIVFVWNKIVEFVEEAWAAIKDLAAFIGGAIANFLDEVDKAIESAQEFIGTGVDALVGVLDGAGAGALGDILELGADILDFGLDRVQDVIGVVSGIFSGDWSGAGESFLSLIGFGKVSRNQSTVSTGRNDDLFDCPLVYQTWQECRKILFFTSNCKTKRTKDFPERKCALPKIEAIQKLEQASRLAKSQDDCRKNSEAKNQGLRWVHELEEDDQDNALLSLDAKMEKTKQPIGKASELAGDGSRCQPLAYKVEVGKLSETSMGVSSDREEASFTSTDCIDYSNKESLGASLSSLQMEVADNAKERSRGNQGRGKDPGLESCAETAGAVCTETPRLTEGSAWQAEPRVNCRADLTRMGDVLGQTIVQQSGNCDPVQPTVSIIEMSDPEDVCGPAMIQVERSFQDCCQQQSNTLSQTLIIEQLPPEYTQAPGSLDVTLDCKANIHPEQFSDPTFTNGCMNSFHDTQITDTTTFTPATCETLISRAHRLVENDCEDRAVTFLQAITLTNDYMPEWDFFPDDVTIGVFDEYGTAAVGFPTAYQPCGAGAVEITYMDAVEQGSCFAERLLKRTFFAKDICGHVAERTQTITVTNDVLPLGELSLARIYGREKVRIPEVKRPGKSGKSKQCVFSAEECGVVGAPTGYKCKSGGENEFVNYQTELEETSSSLDQGALELSCSCEARDPTCDARVINASMDVMYGVQVTVKSGTCNVVSVQTLARNAGTTTTEVSDDCDELPSSKGRKPACLKKTLKGTNLMYNLFEVNAEDFSDKTMVIDVPSTSVVLVQVKPPPPRGKSSKGSKKKNPSVQVGSTARGVELATSVPSNYILWNLKAPVDIKLSGSSSDRWNFRGSLLNGLGDVSLKPGKPKGKGRPVTPTPIWQGQILANELDADQYITLRCDGHFTGFASCSNVVGPAGQDIFS